MAWRRNGDSWQRSLSSWWHEPGHAEAMIGWGLVAVLTLLLVLVLAVLARRRRCDRAVLAAHIAEEGP